jgi:DNA-binding PadR family transcriptional regulator
MSSALPQLELASCPCEGKTLEKLIRPAALIALAEADQCGYVLAQRLGEMPTFAGLAPNAAGVYRALKAMADEGLVEASWELSDAGPAKRTYRLTDRGRNCLARWLDTLVNYRTAIDGLLAIGRAACDAGPRSAAHVGDEPACGCDCG